MKNQNGGTIKSVAKKTILVSEIFAEWLTILQLIQHWFLISIKNISLFLFLESRTKKKGEPFFFYLKKISLDFVKVFKKVEKRKKFSISDD